MATVIEAEARTQTRQRLLEAGAEVFATLGFRQATVRDICARAGANVAAVNYHFGDKRQLYEAVLRHSMGAAIRKYPADLGLTTNATPEQRLHAFVRSFLFRLLQRGAGNWHGQLMAREMVEPTLALDAMVNEIIRPLAKRLEAIIRELAPGAIGKDVRFLAYGIIAQCCFYRHGQAVLSRLYPQQRFAPRDLDNLADQITRFSLAGLVNFAPNGAKR